MDADTQDSMRDLECATSMMFSADVLMRNASDCPLFLEGETDRLLELGHAINEEWMRIVGKAWGRAQ